jgi:membrane protein YdbS with pleckstrin-like domain
VQTVDTAHGPLQQLLGLATVTVTTASARGPVKIAGLAADDAAELARTLTETTQATPGDAT